jgi:hypothetical protein
MKNALSILTIAAIVVGSSLSVGCQTSLNQPIATENIALIESALALAFEAHERAREDLREAAREDDEAKLQQAQRRIDIALETIERLNQRMADTE